MLHDLRAALDAANQAIRSFSSARVGRPWTEHDRAQYRVLLAAWLDPAQEAEDEPESVGV
ncbi:hypothetical protein [Streptacidiphilus cavernicola]|uniref:Uncharacterized protein n=1 Tax=Streptacidiphilus cavernicola TaxID=3342716 RepID=A0ABV6VRF4_9ACTN